MLIIVSGKPHRQFVWNFKSNSGSIVVEFEIGEFAMIFLLVFGAHQLQGEVTLNFCPGFVPVSGRAAERE